MAHVNRDRQSFLRNIAQDKTANTIAISAASLVPLMAMVGGGVDASRFYMAETRLQAACDAGALAARRSMDDDDFSTEHRQIGENFFDQNYSDGIFGTENLTRSYTGTSDGEVNGTAKGTLPTSIMGAFGYDEFSLDVTCTADINISNTDIMFVLDVTGSMNRRPDGTSCSGGCGSSSRLQGLRDAVLTFYDTVDTATSSGAQVRYGVVPYAANVNVGKAILQGNPSWMATEADYQSREPDITFGPWEPTGYLYERTGDGSNYNYNRQINNQTYHGSFDSCVAHYNAYQISDIFVSSNESGWTQVSASGGNPRTVQHTGSVTYEERRGAGGTYYGSSGLCDVNFDIYRYQADSTITVTEEREEIFTWNYTQVTHSLSDLYTGFNSTSTAALNLNVNLPLGANGSDRSINWTGCVEEAATTNVATFNPTTPADAFDLDINLTPTNNDERWKPVLPGAVFLREDGSGNFTRNDILSNDNFDRIQDTGDWTCPAEAITLEDISRGDLNNYLNALRGDGFTYHDIGMIWGARLISPNGIYASSNATAPNGDAISRHIVFMTDGTLDVEPDWYTPYGVEWWDRRVADDSVTSFDDVEDMQWARHTERFQAACRAARQENISVWVVAFGVNLTQNLIDCATPGRAFAATNAAELDEQFRNIAQQIAALRLTQ